MDRWIDIRRSHLDEATHHHHTLICQHLHHVRQPGTRGGSHRGYFRRQYSYETRTVNTLVRQVSFLGRNPQIKAATEIANWTIKQGVEDYSDKSFGTFVWNVIERREYDYLMEAYYSLEFSPAHGPKLSPQVKIRWSQLETFSIATCRPWKLTANGGRGRSII